MQLTLLHRLEPEGHEPSTARINLGDACFLFPGPSKLECIDAKQPNIEGEQMRGSEASAASDSLHIEIDNNYVDTILDHGDVEAEAEAN